MPFVFAVWAHKKNLSEEKKQDLREIIRMSLENGEAHLDTIGNRHGSSIGLTKEETTDFLRGFQYHIGDREKEAIHTFKKLIEEVEVSL